MENEGAKRAQMARNAKNIITLPELKEVSLARPVKVPSFSSVMPAYKTQFPKYTSVLTPMFETVNKRMLSMFESRTNAAMTPAINAIQKAQLAPMESIRNQMTVASRLLSQQMLESIRVNTLVSMPAIRTIPETTQIAARFTAAFTSSIDSDTIRRILDQAKQVEKELAEEGLDSLANEFFEDQPELAATIDQAPFLLRLSSQERRIVVWFTRITVTLWFASFMLGLSVDDPELFNILGILGGPTAIGTGVVVGKATEKALERLVPPDEG